VRQSYSKPKVGRLFETRCIFDRAAVTLGIGSHSNYLMISDLIWDLPITAVDRAIFFLLFRSLGLYTQMSSLELALSWWNEIQVININVPRMV